MIDKFGNELEFNDVVQYGEGIYRISKPIEVYRDDIYKTQDNPLVFLSPIGNRYGVNIHTVEETSKLVLLPKDDYPEYYI